jgi:hypothetical protein
MPRPGGSALGPHLARVGEINPLLWPLLSWLLLLGAFGAGEALLRTFGWTRTTQGLIGASVVLTMVAPCLATAALAMAYRFHAVALERIVRLYLALVLLCANVNFLLHLHFSRAGSPPFHGVRAVWARGSQGTTLQWAQFPRAVLDCVHFSVVTLSTVGYGDTYPVLWYSKLVVDIEILMGLGITVLTVGRHFAGSRAPDRDR